MEPGKLGGEADGAAAVAELPCVFAPALFAGSARCELARRLTVGEGERIACTRAVARSNCAMLDALLAQHCAFALGRAQRGAPPAHATAMRLKCGGLAGIRGALDTPEPDVHRLVIAAQARFGSLAELPWDTVVRGVAGWRPRRRARGERP